MARGDQLSRQWSILAELGRGRRSRRALAAQFKVSRRTISRDIDALSHFPIAEERDGIDVFYACLPGFRPPQVHFTPDEAAALLLGRAHAVPALAGMPHQAHFASALSKVERILNVSSHRQLRDQPPVWQTDLGLPVLRADHAEALFNAALTHHQVQLRYFTAARQASSERVVEPLCLHRHPYGLHLIAYCLNRQAVINFNVNLIDAVRTLPTRFSPDARMFSLTDFLESGFDGHYDPPVIAVRLRVDPPSACWVRDRHFHPTQRVVELADGAIEVCFQAGGLAAIVARILGLGPACEVIAPEALRVAVRTQARAIAARYAD